MRARLAAFGCLLLLSLAPTGWLNAQPRFLDPPVKIGVLYSNQGTMASSERPMLVAAQLAVDEINSKGGVLKGKEFGRRLEIVTGDGQSRPEEFARQAERLIVQEKCVSLFGCWTSASRLAVNAVLKKHGGLLWYPVQYEGEHPSDHIVYTGLTANQQLYPALDWLLKNQGPRIFLLGSDYVYPRTANRLARPYTERRGGVIVGEVYRPLGAEDFGPVVEAIKAARPDAILNTLNGSSNQAFFRALARAGISAQMVPVMSLSIAEVELEPLLPEAEGHFATWSYFESLNSAKNRRFLKAFHELSARDGSPGLADDPIQTAYWQIIAYAVALNRAKTTDPRLVREAARGRILEAPEGLVRIDPRNLHTWKVARVGQILADRQFRIVWSSETPIRPEPLQR